MKYIAKQHEPQVFTDWKAMANDNWQPSYESLSGTTKRAVKLALMNEQGHICCYCERRLTEEDSHIEHLRPQSDPACDSLDYNNMLCSCTRKIIKGDPRHCGNLKGSWFDERLIISPLDPACENKFSYTADGHIKPADSSDNAAQETIKKLGLGIPKLNDLRKKAIEPFLDEGISDGELEKFVTGYLKQDSSGRYGEFWTTIRYLFEDYIMS